MKPQKKHIVDILIIGGFLLLGVIASPPNQLLSMVWLLVAFGILQVISAKLYRATVRSTQKRLTYLYRDFEETTKQRKELLDFQEFRVNQLKTILRNHHISIGESI